MPTDPLRIAIKGTTQDHLPIEDIVGGMVILKDGSCATVLQVSSVNFDLLSEREQSALIFAYGGILNSLSFPVQIVIKSNTKDVTTYLDNLRNAQEKQTNPLLRERIESYRKFIEETVKKNDVLSKAFYVVVQFSILELGIKSAHQQLIDPMSPFGMFKKSMPTALPFPKEYILEKAKASLEPKRDHIVRLFSRLGLEIKVLDTRELIELYYKIYNQETSANEKIQTLNYTSTVVTTKK